MTLKRATPVCRRCRINPTDSVRHDTCPACWADVERAMTYNHGGPIADYLRTWSDR